MSLRKELRSKDARKMELKGTIHNWIYKKQRKELRQKLIEELKNISYEEVKDYTEYSDLKLDLKLKGVKGSELDISIDDKSNDVVFKKDGKETRLRILFCFTSVLTETIIKKFCQEKGK